MSDRDWALRVSVWGALPSGRGEGRDARLTGNLVPRGAEAVTPQGPGRPSTRSFLPPPPDLSLFGMKSGWSRRREGGPRASLS